MAVILVVDSESTFRTMVRRTLEREGHKIIIASTGEEGLALARDRRPDLIILDLILPEMSGLDVCRTLRKDSTVPVIIATEKNDEVDKVVGLRPTL